MAFTDELKSSSGRKSKSAVSSEKKGFKESFIPSKNDSKSELIRKYGVLAAAVVLLVCIVILIGEIVALLQENNIRDKVVFIYQPDSINNYSNETVTQINDDTGEVEVVYPPMKVMSEAQELIDINPDTVGYIYIPNTGINSVVVQAEDNDYYLDHNFYGNKAQCGTVFADFRSTINSYEQSDHIVLYGHNQKNGTMFGDMDYYRWNLEYYKSNPVITFNTNCFTGKYKIFANFVTNVLPEHDNGYVFNYADYIELDDPNTFKVFMDNVMVRTLIFTGVDVKYGDKILTLSTCSTEFEPSRHIIMARKIREGEDETVDTSKFEINPNPKWPEIYQRYSGSYYIEPNQ